LSPALDRCPYCQRLEPTWNALPSKLAAAGVATKIARMNVDTYTAYGQAYGVTGFPTLMLFQDGRPVGQKTGLIDMAAAMKYAGVKVRPRPTSRDGATPVFLPWGRCILFLVSPPPGSAGIARVMRRLGFLSSLFASDSSRSWECGCSPSALRRPKPCILHLMPY
jgi:hypothetical protein